MLVLKRRVGQSVRITTPTGDHIWVKVTRAVDGTLRLAFDAPRSFEINRYGGSGEPPAPKSMKQTAGA